jgi:uncharacterized protein HemX
MSPRVDVAELTLSVRTMVAIAFVIITTMMTGAGVYYGLQSKLSTLTDKVTALEVQNAAQSRALLELTIPLKVKGVVEQ